MFCTVCGQPAMPDAAFCSRCGQPLLPAVPPQPFDAPRVKKSRAGMAAGIAAGVAAMIALLAVALFVWPGFAKAGSGVDGVWYSEELGEAIRFGPDSAFYAQTPYGDFGAGTLSTL